MDKILVSLEREIASKYKMDKRVIHQICNHPILFTKRCVEGSEQRPIRIRHFGVFVQKEKLNKQYVMDNILKRLLCVEGDDRTLLKDLLEVLFNEKYSVEDYDCEKKINELHQKEDLRNLKRLYRMFNFKRGV
jgi:hypothetical protein